MKTWEKSENLIKKILFITQKKLTRLSCVHKTIYLFILL